MIAHLLKLAKQILESAVISVVSGLLDRMESEVRSKMTSHLQNVNSGMWTGPGANRFVEEVSNDGVNVLNQILGDVRGCNDNIIKARDIIEQADRDVRTAVARIEDAFEAI